MMRLPSSFPKPSARIGGGAVPKTTLVDDDGDGGDATGENDGPDLLTVRNPYDSCDSENPSEGSGWRKKKGLLVKEAAGSRDNNLDMRIEIDSSPRSVFTLFVNDIFDCIGYQLVRGMFAQIGTVVRMYRFGFIRFSSLEVASHAINLLNGFLLGDGSL